MHTLLLSFCLLVACGDKDQPADDSGPAATDYPGTDGGTSDGGTASTDGGTSDGGTPDGGTPDGGTTTLSMADFALPDLNPGSARYGQTVSPRDYLEQVSGWYFTHAT